MAGSDEDVYCICRGPYVENQFMIACDKCSGWFHGSCVNVREDQAPALLTFHCPPCQKKHGPSTWMKSDWQNQSDGLSAQNGIMNLINELKQRSFPRGDEIILKMNGKDLTSSFLATNGFNVPILVERKDGLGLHVPPPSFSVENVEERIGSEFEIDVIDVLRQEDQKMLMRDWREYYNCPGQREKILNVISLEFSKTRLSELVEPPNLVREVSWVSTLWPDDCRVEELMPERPYVQKYCLMGVKDSFTNFHIDFGGTSVWYHVLKGEKVFYLVQPTEDNLKQFEVWQTSPMPSDTFFGDLVERCWKLVVKAGQTLFIPTAWIHAVYTPIDSIVFGGNFLHTYNVQLQLEAYDIERRVKPPEKYMFPSYDTVNWLAAKDVLDMLQGHYENCSQPPLYVVEAGRALAFHLKQWIRRKDCPKKTQNALLQTEGIEYGKLLKQLNAELKRYNSVTRQESPSKAGAKSKKSEKKSGKKKKKKDEPVADPMQLSLSLLHQKTEESLKAAENEQKMKIYTFEDEEEERLPPTVLKVRLPVPADLRQKEEEQKIPPFKLRSSAKEVDTKKSKRKKGRSKKGGTRTKSLAKQEEKEGLRVFIKKGKVTKPGVSQDSVDKPPTLPPLKTSWKEDVLEDEDSDKDNLVVDETPRAQQNNRKTAAVKPESPFKNLNWGMENAFKKSPTVDTPSSALSQDSVSSQCGNGSTIADILRVTARDFSNQSGLSMSTTMSSAQMLAAEGMLSMSQGSLFQSDLDYIAPGFTKVSPKATTAKDEEVQLMADCYQDDQYMYPTFEMSEEEEQMGRKTGRSQEKDDNWNPKARVNVPTRTDERSQRVGAKNQAVASGLAATSKILSNQSLSTVMKPARKSLVKSKPPEQVQSPEPTPGPSTSLESGLKRPIDRSSSTPVQPKAKKPKKGMATPKQRLSKLLKMNVRH